MHNVWCPIKKITRHAKEEENTTQNEWGESINQTNPKMTQMLELVDKTIKKG